MEPLLVERLMGLFCREEKKSIFKNKKNHFFSFISIQLNVVDYSKIVGSSELKETLTMLSQKHAVKNFTHDEFLTFYINAYNVLAVDTIVRHQCEGKKLLN